jgi:ribosomal protein L37AE/L43A
MMEDEMIISIYSKDCPLCEDEQITRVHTLDGSAECAHCETNWVYGATELLEILNNLEG